MNAEDWLRALAQGVTPGWRVQRASDEDRRRAADLLAEAYADGRLDVEGHARRLEGVVGAGTMGELADLTQDLGGGALVGRVTDSEVAAYVKDRRRSAWQRWLVAGAVLSAMWVVFGIPWFVAGGFPYFWPVWPLGIAALVMVFGELGDRRERAEHARRVLERRLRRRQLRRR